MILIFKRLVSITLICPVFISVVGCNPLQKPPQPTSKKTDPISSAEQRIKNLESKELKGPIFLKEIVRLHGQCAALSYPNKLLRDSILITRTNIYKYGKRIKASCIMISEDLPKGVENLSGDLVVFGFYTNINSLVVKLPPGYVLNIEQRSEKNQASIIPWIVKKP
jgi:hypothetical protein